MARKLDESSVPHHWRYELLDKMATRCSGHTPSKSYPEYWNGGIKWVSLADSHRLDQGYIYETDKEISDEGIKNSSAQSHPAETVILSRDAGIGKSAVLAEPMAVSQHFIAWICDNKETLHSWFLYNWLQLNKPEFERQAVGSTIKTIGLPYFKKLKVLAPPFSEQKKISQILSTWDKAIVTTEQMLANSQQQKKALMQQLLTGKKRLLDENGVRFSGAWEAVHLGDICTVNPKKATEPEGSQVSFVGMDSVSEDARLIYTTTKHYNEVSKGFTSFRNNDVLVAKITPCFENGKGAYVYGLVNEIGFGSTEFHVLRATERSNSKYLYYLTNTTEFRIRGEANMQGSAGQKRVSTDYLKTFKVKVPPSVKEQAKVAELLWQADKELSVLEIKLNKLKQEKKALMQQLLTGKRRVKIEG